MVRAFVFVEATAGAAGKLPTLLREVESVTDARVVAGDHDVVVEIETEAVYDVLSTVTNEVRPLDGIDATRTYVALE